MMCTQKQRGGKGDEGSIAGLADSLVSADNDLGNNLGIPWKNASVGS
jgi:hypothetical protein